MADPQKALRWIVSILNKHNVPFQIVGGLAARAYGATRELVDIDIYAPGKYFDVIVKEAKDHLTWGPEHWKSESWDITFMKLEFAGQKIEIGDSEDTKWFDTEKQKWTKEKINYSESEIKKIYDIKVPVIPKEKLIAYKRKLNREVDKIDITQIEEAP